MGIIAPNKQILPLFRELHIIQRPEFNTVRRDVEKLRQVYRWLLSGQNPVAVMAQMDALGVMDMEFERRMHDRVAYMRGPVKLRTKESNDFVSWLRQMNPVQKEIVALFGKGQTDEAHDAQVLRYDAYGSRMGYWTGDPSALVIEREMLGLEQKA